MLESLENHWPACMPWIQKHMEQVCQTDAPLPDAYIAVEKGKVVGGYTLAVKEILWSEDKGLWIATLYVDLSLIHIWLRRCPVKLHNRSEQTGPIPQDRAGLLMAFWQSRREGAKIARKRKQGEHKTMKSPESEKKLRYFFRSA